MRKISLKSILKKTFKKKTKNKIANKVKKSKKPKIKKIQKIQTKIQKKLKEKNKIKIEKKVKTSNENLRIPKNNELKPEIKKVKKQNTEKRDYKIKDYIVYPKHGVGQITEFKKINIGGIDVETYIIKFDKDKANGMVPVNTFTSTLNY